MVASISRETSRYEYPAGGECNNLAELVAQYPEMKRSLAYPFFQALDLAHTNVRIATVETTYDVTGCLAEQASVEQISTIEVVSCPRQNELRCEGCVSNHVQSRIDAISLHSLGVVLKREIDAPSLKTVEQMVIDAIAAQASYINE